MATRYEINEEARIPSALAGLSGQLIAPGKDLTVKVKDHLVGTYLTLYRENGTAIGTETTTDAFGRADGPDGNGVWVDKLDHNIEWWNGATLLYTQKVRRGEDRLLSVESGQDLLFAAAFNVKDPQWGPSALSTHGAIGDGATHPLSGFFATLVAAQAVYPHATSLTQELDWAASQKACAAAETANGAAVVFPPDCSFLLGSDGLNVDGSNGVKICGLGGGVANLAEPVLTYSGTSGTIVSAKTTQGFGLHGLRIVASASSFSGYFVDFNPGSGGAISTLGEVTHCWFNGSGASPGAAAGVHATSLIGGRIEFCSFQWMQFGIVGWDGGPGIAQTNVIRVADNTFNFLSVAAIVNMQEAWVVSANAFEPLLSGRTCPIGRTGDVATTANGAQALPAATVTVVSTADFPTAGQVSTPQGVITYTGKTATTFTGCTGGTGTLTNGAAVWAGPYASAVTAALNQPAIEIENNWWGDQTVAGGYQIGGQFQGTEIHANYMSVGSNAPPTDFIRLASTSAGVDIHANYVPASNSVAANFVSLNASITGVDMHANHLVGTALTPYSGTPGPSFRFAANSGTAPGATRTVESGVGTATLVAGTVTVSTTLVTANSVILLTCQTPGGTPGFLRVSARTAGTSFTILSSSGTDTSVVGYRIAEPA